MSILDTLKTKGSNYSKLNGADASKPDFKESKLHDTYSINGDPKFTSKPEPSILDLDGKTPSKYLDNLPK